MNGSRRSVGFRGTVLTGGVAAIVVLATLAADSLHTTVPAADPARCVLITWGDPSFTFGNDCRVPGPAWWLGACQEGGAWRPDVPAWTVPAAQPPDTGCLYLFLDRGALSSDIAMQVDFFDAGGVSLFADLVDPDRETVAADLCGNLATGSGVPMKATLVLPLHAYPAATAVRLRRGMGDVIVYRSALYPLSATASSTEDGTSSSPGLSRTAIPLFSAKPAATSSRAPSGTPTASTPPVSAKASSAQNGGGPVVSSNRVFYVSATLGDDANTGLSSNVLGAASGPVRTINSALGRALAGDTVVVAGGTYTESVNIDALNGSFIIQGDVKLR